VEKLSLELPMLYGDHHAAEVRRIILEMPGVAEVYASSSFRLVEVAFDPEKVDAESIKTRLDEAGYLGDLELPAETGTPAAGRNGRIDKTHFRRSNTIGAAGNVVGFVQEVSRTGRRLWPCPGMGALKTMEEGE